jgi:hypothetical protein
VSELVQHLAEVIPGHLRKEVERELLTGWRMQEASARHQADQLGAFHKNLEAKDMGKIGRKIASIPPESYHYWGHRLGYECWSDKAFMDEFLRDNPNCGVNYGKRTMVGGAKEFVDQFGKKL